MHILCPHCRNPIELVRLKPGEEIACPSCGSSFRLEAESTTGWTPQDDQKLGRFEVLGSVGQGAFGTVYKARDPQLDRTVALKVPRAGNLAGPQELDRFLREARSVAQLRHPSIVAVHEVGQTDGVPYLVSDFVEGVTLADLLSARRPTPREAAEIIAAVADALHYAHQKGVVHRDVKPSNIMIGPNGEPSVMDFGLAKRDAGEITMTIEGQVLGTPAYMAPEQARGDSHGVDGRSDVYSLGVILYLLLTGELPFRGTTRMLLHQVLHDEPRPPRRLNDRVPRELETICLKCLRKEPGRRYATAADLAADLRRWLCGEPIAARPVGKLERGWRWCRRNAAVAGLLGAVAATLLLGTTVATFFAVQAEREARAKEQQRQDAVAQREEADRQQRRTTWEAEEKERQRQEAVKQTREAETQKARAEGLVGEKDRQLQRVKSALKTAQLLRVELVGKSDPEEGWLLLRDEAVYPTAERDFAWGVYNCWCQRQGVRTGLERDSLKGHTDNVWCVVFSPDGKTLASASADKTVKLWDTHTGQERATLQGHADPVSSVAFSPDGKTLASASGEGNQPGEIKLWDAVTGRERASLKGHTGVVSCVVFSPDGKTLASAGHDPTIKLWDAMTGRERASLKGHTGLISSVSFSPDGKTLASASFDKTIKLWDAVTGQERASLQGHTDGVWSLNFSPDGKTLASASRDRTVKLWDTVSGQERASLKGHTASVQSVVFSPDGKTLASASEDKTVKLWDAVPLDP